MSDDNYNEVIKTGKTKCTQNRRKKTPRKV